MRPTALIAATVMVCLPVTPHIHAGEEAGPPPLKHSSPDPMICTTCSASYEKAMGYVRGKLKRSSFPVKMVAGWLLLADGRFKDDLEHCVDCAVRWRQQGGYRENSHSGNWYPALAAVFLAEYYKYVKDPRVLAAMNETVTYFVGAQEPKNDGWWKWKEGAYNERLDYPVVNHGYVMSLVMTFFHTARLHGVKIPEEAFKKGEAALLNITTRRGIGYGLPRKGGQGWGDKTGARGAWVIQALAYTGNLEHEIWKTYEPLLSQLIPQMDQGHHVGAFHGLALTLGCHIQGPKRYQELADYWLPRLMKKQGEEGNLYIGDDGDAGGEPGLLGGDVGSTAAFALLILLQDHKRLTPVNRGRASDGTLTFQVDVARKREEEHKTREEQAHVEAKRKAAEEARQRRAVARERILEAAGKTWDAKLTTRVREAVQAKEKFTFACEMLRGEATIGGVDDRGQLLLSDKKGQISIPVAPGMLPMADRCHLALALVRPGKPEDCAIAAFYSLAHADEESGQKMLKQGGPATDLVRSFFKELGILE